MDGSFENGKEVIPLSQKQSAIPVAVQKTIGLFDLADHQVNLVKAASDLDKAHRKGTVTLLDYLNAFETNARETIKNLDASLTTTMQIIREEIAEQEKESKARFDVLLNGEK